MPSDMSFERKFGQLADAALNEKIPSLIDYRIGFQVIDKNEEETQAVGIAAFILNELWIYVPIFFIKGALRGFDLMYLQQKDIFLPAKDNWVTMLKEQGISRLGRSIDFREEQTRRTFPPDQIALYTNPSTLGRQKLGSAVHNQSSLIDKEVLHKMMTSYGTFHPDLVEFVPKIGRYAGNALVNTIVSSPEFANAAFAFYDPDQLHKTASEILARSAPPDAPKPSQVQIYTPLQKEAQEDLNESEKKLLMRNGLYIRDTRTNHSRVFQNEIDTHTLQNPTSPGIYQIFLRDGTFRTAAVLFPTCYTDLPITMRRSETVAGRPTEFFSRPIEVAGRPLAIIDLDKPQVYIKANSRNVLVKPPENLTEEQMRGINSGREATMQNVAKLSDGDYLLLVQTASPGASTAISAIETKILGKSQDIDGNTHVIVYEGSGHMMPEPGAGNHPGQISLEFTGKPGRLVRRGLKIFIPEGTKMFSMGEKDDKPALVFGDVETAYQVMHKTAEFKPLRIYSDGGMASVESYRRSTGFVTKLAALESLVCEHGVFAGQAVQMLKEASRSEGKLKTYQIKYAAPYDISAYDGMQLPFMGGPAGRQEEAVTETITALTGKKLSGPVDSQGTSLLPQHIIQQAMRAADAGIKEVFDVSVLQGLVDIADLSELRKDFIADMIRGMDRTGRMLFLFYWHNDEFEERYGKDDMKKLEETLKQTFSKMGDLILFLKEKTDYTPSLSENLFGELSEDIGVANVAP